MVEVSFFSAEVCWDISSEFTQNQVAICWRQWPGLSEAIPPVLCCLNLRLGLHLGFSRSGLQDLLPTTEHTLDVPETSWSSRPATYTLRTFPYTLVVYHLRPGAFKALSFSADDTSMSPVSSLPKSRSCRLHVAKTARVAPAEIESNVPVFLDGLLFQCLVERTWGARLDPGSQIWTVRLSLRDRALETRLDHFKGAKDSGRTGLPCQHC